MSLPVEEKVFLPQINSRRSTVSEYAKSKDVEAHISDIEIRADDSLDLTIKYFDNSEAKIGDVPLYFIEKYPKNFLEGRLDDEFEQKVLCTRLIKKFLDWYDLVQEDVNLYLSGIELPVFVRGK
jgi:hypothetical protein